jgi:hypothetical protein
MIISFIKQGLVMVIGSICGERMSMLSSLRRAVAMAAAVMTIGSPSTQAGEPATCDQFDWPLAEERGWFAHHDVEPIESGTRLDRFWGAVGVTLRPVAEDPSIKAPKRRSKVEKNFGARIEVPAPDKAGLYQITLSNEGRIDVVQHGISLQPVAVTDREGCPSVRKSVRFDLAAEPFTVLINGASEDVLRLAISTARAQ